MKNVCMFATMCILLTLSTDTIVLHASQDIKVEYNIGNNIDLIDSSTNQKIGILQYVATQKTHVPYWQQVPGSNRSHAQSGQHVLFKNDRKPINHGWIHRSNVISAYQTNLTGISRSLSSSTTIQEAYALGAQDSLQKYGAEIMKVTLKNAQDESKQHSETIRTLHDSHEFNAMLYRNSTSSFSTSAFNTGVLAGFIVGCVYAVSISTQKK